MQSGSSDGPPNLTVSCLMPKEREIDDMVPKVSPQTTESMTQTKSGSDIEKTAALIKATELGVKIGMGTGTEIGMGTGTEIGMGTGTEIGMGTGTGTEIGMGTGTGTEIGTGTGTEIGTGTGTGSEAGLGAGTGTKIEIGAEIGMGAGTGTGTKIGIGTKIGMGERIKSEVEMGIKTNGEMKTDTSIIIESLDLSIPETQDVHDPSKVNKLWFIFFSKNLLYRIHIFVCQAPMTLYIIVYS